MEGPAALGFLGTVNDSCPCHLQPGGNVGQRQELRGQSREDQGFPPGGVDARPAELMATALPT